MDGLDMYTMYDSFHETSEYSNNLFLIIIS